jgi:hypothetical protein
LLISARPSPGVRADEDRTPARLIIDLDLNRLPNDRAKEASRILRYWAGALPRMDLTQPAEHALMDSNYRAVGRLRLLDADATDTPEATR